MLDGHKAVKVLRELGLLEMSSSQVPPEILDTSRPQDEEHRVFAHDPVWAYLPPKIFDQDHRLPDGRPLVSFLDLESTPAKAALLTRLLVFVGVTSSQALNEAAATGAICLVFEPERKHFLEHVARLSTKELARRNVLYFVGHPEGFAKALLDLLPANLAGLGFPAVFSLPSVEASHPRYLRDLVRVLELFYFRHVLYRHEGQGGQGDIPSIPMMRGITWDQQLHLFRNLPLFRASPSIEPLRGACAGATAVLVAAGPDLKEKIGWLRDNLDKAVVICVNSALRPLLAEGIKPHLVVINDTSEASADSLRRLPPHEGVGLVAHALAGITNIGFDKIYLFGTVLSPLFPSRPMLRLHGSVITTAFSLAKHLGCTRVVLLGVQLASQSQRRMDYAEGTIQAEQPEVRLKKSFPPGIKFPNLMPVEGPGGQKLYTTPNFQDAALWILDEIAASGMEVINLSRHTIVYGKGILLDPSYAVENPVDARAMLAHVPSEAPAVDEQAYYSFVREQHAFWQGVRDVCMSFPDDLEGDQLQRALQLLALFRENNVAYLMQRMQSADLDIDSFNKSLYGPDQSEAPNHLARYLRICAKMAEFFLLALEKA